MIVTEELIATIKSVFKADKFADLLIRDHYRASADKRAVSLMLSWNERDATGERDRRYKEIPVPELGGSIHLNDYREPKLHADHFYGRVESEYLRSLLRVIKPGDDLAGAITIGDGYGYFEIGLSRKDGRSNRSVEVYRAIVSAGKASNFFGSN